MPGSTIKLFGDIRLGASGYEIYHPEYEFIDANSPAAQAEPHLTPIYSVCAGVSQPRLRKLCEQALEYLRLQAPEELFEASVNQHFGVQNLAEALHFVHSPPADANQQQLKRALEQQGTAAAQLGLKQLEMLVLKQQLEKLGLPTAGTKADLEDRLRHAAQPLDPSVQ